MPAMDAGEIDRQKRAVALAAAELVRDGDRVGLGTGTTVAHLPALAARGLELRCTATSPETERRARELGLSVEPLDGLGALDITIDGADQIDPQGWLIKGGGAARTPAKIVAAAARFVVVVSADKLVNALRAQSAGDLGFGAELRWRAWRPRAGARCRAVPTATDRRLPGRGRRPRRAGRAPVGHAGPRRARPVRPRW